jgi:plastocyanin
MQLRSRLLAALVISIGAAACSSSDGPGPPPNNPVLDRVVVSPQAISIAAGQTQPITSQGQTPAGDPIAATTFAYSSASTNVATVSATGVVTGLSAGQSTITVTGTAGGVSKSATITATVTGTLPNEVTVAASGSSNVFTPASVAIARGGTVTWTFGAIPHNVIFGGAAGAPANINTTSNNAGIARTFNTSGNFDYTCSLHQGMNGNVIVP